MKEFVTRGSSNVVRLETRDTALSSRKNWLLTGESLRDLKALWMGRCSAILHGLTQASVSIVCVPLFRRSAPSAVHFSAQ